MNNKSKGLLIFLSIFVFLQAVLDIFLAIEQFEDFLNSDTADWIKYISIISCFLVSFLSIKTKKGYFVIAGLAFTLVADYFLLILDEYYVLGISAFIITQAMYFLYIKPKHWKISLVIRFGVYGLVAVLLPLAFKVKEASAFLAAFYFINLVMNAVDAYISKDKALLMFAIGLTFFIGCDLFVCLYNIKDYVTISSNLIKTILKFGLIGSWVCYIPSQTLISISPLFREKIDSLKTKQCEE